MIKPLGIKNYGSIPHLLGSRTGPSDRTIGMGQQRICCEKKRDKHDLIIVQEKLDGSNVGITRFNGELIGLTRNGWEISGSPFPTHQSFHKWFQAEKNRFEFLQEGERLCGEWLAQAIGTRYKLGHEPFVVFDLMTGTERVTYNTLIGRLGGNFVIPNVISFGEPISIEDALKELGEFGAHGALEAAEGCVWRVERLGKVDFLCKYVRPEKVDGKYIKKEGNEVEEIIWNLEI